jgi:hypothetical protein
MQTASEMGPMRRTTTETTTPAMDSPAGPDERAKLGRGYKWTDKEKDLFRRNLKRFRAEAAVLYGLDRGLTSDMLAVSLGTTVDTLRNLEHARHLPELPLWDQIASRLGHRRADFLMESPPPPDPALLQDTVFVTVLGEPLAPEIREEIAATVKRVNTLHIANLRVRARERIERQQAALLANRFQKMQPQAIADVLQDPDVIRVIGEALLRAQRGDVPATNTPAGLLRPEVAPQPASSAPAAKRVALHKGDRDRAKSQLPTPKKDTTPARTVGRSGPERPQKAARRHR